MKAKTLSRLIAITAFLIASYGGYYVLHTTERRRPTPAGYYYTTYVFDGDTIEIDMNGTPEKVRMIGVDTPETHKPNTPVQCFGVLASEYTKEHLNNKNVRLESDPINQDRDRYGRLLRYVYLQDGTLWNAELIRQGYGHALTAFPFTKVDEFQAYETESREQNRGLWSACRE